MFSLRKPIQGLSPLQRLLWPLIWLRLLMLKAHVRSMYGPGVPFAFLISGWGEVTLSHLPFENRAGTIPAHLVPGPAPAARALSPALRRLYASLVGCDCADTAPACGGPCGPFLHAAHARLRRAHPRYILTRPPTSS